MSIDAINTSAIRPVTEDAEPGETESLGLQPLVREMLHRIGEDPEREGLLKTPERVDRAWA